MPRLGSVLGFDDGALWVKRDDLTALAGGGNKARKLEFLVADALAAGADVLVTGGAPQSNHVRMTAAAAGMAGMACVAVIGGPAPEAESYEGNLVLDALLGAEPVWVGGHEAVAIERVLAETVEKLAAEGRRPYGIPLGGASALGCLGYVTAADELSAEMPAGALVYTATGTGGTQAGLAVGLGDLDRVRGVDVGAVPQVDERILGLLPAVAELARRPEPVGSLVLDGSQVGAGYGARTDACREAIELAARHEGVLVDPVYSGKALAGLVADRRAGRLAADQPVVFLHTGGLPTLFVRRYRDWLAGND
jgi:1-aminocyclopropane-1-carboxylate deaminase/D-cysteine desulfhydrase-like pyridoxal-dependent ACC family enzyme